MEPYCLLFHLDSLRNRNGSFLILLSKILNSIWNPDLQSWGDNHTAGGWILSQRPWNTEPARAWWDWAIKLNGTFISADKRHVTIAPDLKKAFTECSLYWTSYHTWKDRGTRLRITSDTPTTKAIKTPALLRSHSTCQSGVIHPLA